MREVAASLHLELEVSACISSLVVTLHPLKRPLVNQTRAYLTIDRSIREHGTSSNALTISMLGIMKPPRRRIEKLLHLHLSASISEICEPGTSEY